MDPTTFAELKLSEAVQQALRAEKYTTPTPIQAQSIPHLLAGSDLLGCAQTGTGKTAAFALPIIHRLDQDRKNAAPHEPRVLVLSPTRELASQIGRSFESYGRFIKFRQAVIYGGVGQSPQVKALTRGVHVLIATPGRLLDLMDQGHVRLDKLDTFVLDEADRMLDMGFMPDIKRIVSKLPQERQSLFFSATMPGKIADLAKKLLKDPVRVSVAPQSTTVERIEQSVLMVNKSDKRALLQHVLADKAIQRVLVFTRTKHGADKVVRQLYQNGVHSEAIHGGKTQATRERALLRFRRGGIKVLVATDLAARGIDIDGITHVINYDLPQEAESYVHRIGRTGRAGATGTAISFCDAEEHRLLRDIERITRQSIRIEAQHPFHRTGGLPAASAQPQQKKAAPKQGRPGGSHRKTARRVDGGSQEERRPFNRKKKTNRRYSSLRA